MPYSVERAARAIVSAIDAPREVVIGAIPRAFTLFKMLARPLYDRLQPKMIQSSHFTDESAAESAGNLFMPQGRNSEAGGWLEGRRKLGVAAAIALPLLGAAALFFGRTRRGRLLAGRAADAARGLAKPVREALGRGFPALAG